MKISKKTTTTPKGVKVSYNFTAVSREEKDTIVKALELLKDQDKTASYLYNFIGGLDEADDTIKF